MITYSLPDLLAIGYKDTGFRAEQPGAATISKAAAATGLECRDLTGFMLDSGEWAYIVAPRIIQATDHNTGAPTYYTETETTPGVIEVDELPDRIPTNPTCPREYCVI